MNLLDLLNISYVDLITIYKSALVIARQVGIMAIALVVGYLLGSINPAIIISKIKGKDLRKMGSHNAGATNMLRSYGKKLAIWVTILDIVKTLVSILIAIILAKHFSLEERSRLMQILAGAGCILGHNFPLYFKFKGGKGVLCSITAIMCIDYRIGIMAILVFIMAVIIFRMVSLGSMIGAISAVVIAIVGKEDYYRMGFIIFAAVLLIYQHRDNIVRIIKGKENKIEFKKKKKEKEKEKVKVKETE